MNSVYPMTLSTTTNSTLLAAVMTSQPAATLTEAYGLEKRGITMLASHLLKHVALSCTQLTSDEPL
jgi:hypothetical protein